MNCHKNKIKGRLNQLQNDWKINAYEPDTNIPLIIKGKPTEYYKKKYMAKKDKKDEKGNRNI